MLQDPALLRWLDAPTNRKGHANENLGRELMELFTLGIGNYTEADVKEVARALTGIGVTNGEFRFDRLRHDDGEKTVLGQTEDFAPDSVAKLLLANHATSRRLAGKLIAEFFAPGVVDAAAEKELAEHLFATRLNIGKVVETILRSELFFCDANLNKRITDPLTFLIAPVRAFELFEEPPSTMILAEWLRRMGLDLFYPPNVAGWPGGRAWLTTRTIIARANYGAAILSGEIYRTPQPLKIEQVAKKHNIKNSHDFQSLAETLIVGGTKTQCETDSYDDILLHLLTGIDVHLH